MKRKLSALFSLLLATFLITGCNSSTKKDDTSTSGSGSEPGVSLLEEAKALSSRVNDVPSISEIVGEDIQKNQTLNEVFYHHQLVRDDMNEALGQYDYTYQQTDALCPSPNYMPEGLNSLFTIDSEVAMIGEEIDAVLDLVPKFNEWFNYKDKVELRVVFIPALHYLRVEEKMIGHEGYFSFSIQENENNKVVLTEKTYYGGMYDQYQHAIWFYETHYVEDEYFELVSTREFDGLGREWCRSFTRMDFQEKIIRYYDRFTQGYETTINERYGEAKYGSGEYLGYITNDEWLSVFNSQFELSNFLYNAFLLYDLEGYESITCEQEIQYYASEEGNTRQYNLPLSIKMKDGTVYTNGVNNINLYVETFYLDSGELVILPYILSPTADPSEAVEYLSSLGFTLKYDYVSIYNDLLIERDRFMNDGSIEEYRDLTNARYEHLSMEIIESKFSVNNQEPIDKQNELTYINSSYSGNVSQKDGKINLNGAAFTIGQCENYNKQNAMIDVYMVSTEDNYLIGHQEVEYKGEESTFNLNFDLELDGVLPSPANYEVRIMLRSNGQESFLLKGENIDFTDSNGYHFYTNEDGELHVQVNRRSLDSEPQ